MDDGPPIDRELFDAALEIADPVQRAAFVERQCAGRVELRDRVLALLKAFASADGFLEATRRVDAGDRPAARQHTAIVPCAEQGPGSTIGKYKLLQELGEGGFGVVYMAEQLQPVKRRVALKIIKPGMDTREVVARFEAERQALAMMVHPNIAQVYDAGATESGRPFFVMELVKGIPLTEFSDTNRLSTVTRLELFLAVCSAVQHAHQKGVIHRDLKPSNILVTLHDGKPVPKVIDFGIAKALNQELTEKTLFTAYGQLIGTPQYMSPEQAEMSGLDIDTRSDIYSLGVLLYELLTGATPISRQELQGAGYQEMQQLIREREPTKPSMLVGLRCRDSTVLQDLRREAPAQLISAIKGDLDWIVLKALEKDRSRRYETAAGFADDIRRYLSHEPVSASPPTLGYVFGKYWKRHHKLLAAGVSILVALLIGVVGMTILYYRSETAKREGVRQTARAEGERREATVARQAETDQRQLAQRHAERLRETLSRADLVSGVELLKKGEDRRALAYLGRSLRTDGTSLPAAQALVAALTDHNFDLRPELILRHDTPISSFALARGGRHLLTRAEDGIVRLWEARTWELRKEFGPEFRVSSAYFLPGGEDLVLISRDGQVRVWDPSTLQLRGPPVIPDGGVAELQVARSPGGRLILVTRSNRGSLQVWDGQTGHEVTAPLGVGGEVVAKSFQLNEPGTLLLAQFGQRWLGCWDTESGQPAGPPIDIMGHRHWMASLSEQIVCVVNGPANALAFFALRSGGALGELTFAESVAGPPTLACAGRRLLVPFRSSPRSAAPPGSAPASSTMTRILELPGLKVVGEITEPATAGLPEMHAAAGFSLVRLNDFQLRVRSLADGRIVKEIDLEARMAEENRKRDVLTFSPSGMRFVVRFADNRLAVFHAATGERLGTTPPQTAPLRGIFFSDDERRLATRTPEGVVQVWDVASCVPITAPLRHNYFVGDIAFTPDNRRIVSRDYSLSQNLRNYGVVRVWDAEEGRAGNEALALPPVASGSAFDVKADRLALATRSNAVLVVELESRAVLRTLAVDGPTVDRLVLSIDGQRLAAAVGNQAWLWNLESATPGVGLPLGSRIMGLRFDASGSRLATVVASGGGARIQVWDAVAGRPVTPPWPLGQPTSLLGFTPDGRRLVGATRDSVWAWDLASEGSTGPVPQRLTEAHLFAQAALSPDGSNVLTFARNEFQLRDPVSGGLRDSFSHESSLSSAVFSPDGRRVLVTGSNKRADSDVPGFAILWDLDSRKRVAQLVHPDQVTRARLSPDGRLAVTLEQGRALRIWELGTGQLFAELPVQEAPVDFLEISGNGRTVVSLSRGRVFLWPLPSSDPAIPAWLPDLAEAVAGHRLDDQSNVEPLPADALPLLRARLGRLTGSDDYSRFARWFVADRAQRTLSPRDPRSRATATPSAEP
jgi:eukaryotic-like serine/threonine-protein kinase